MPQPSRTTEWTNGDILDAPDLNTEFQTLYNLLSGSLDTGNFADGSTDLAQIAEAGSLDDSNIFGSGVVTTSAISIDSDLDFGGNKLSNLAKGTDSNDAVRLDQFDQEGPFDQSVADGANTTITHNLSSKYASGIATVNIRSVPGFDADNFQRVEINGYPTDSSGNIESFVTLVSDSGGGSGFYYRAWFFGLKA